MRHCIWNPKSKPLNFLVYEKRMMLWSASCAVLQDRLWKVTFHRFSSHFWEHWLVYFKYLYIFKSNCLRNHFFYLLVLKLVGWGWRALFFDMQTIKNKKAVNWAVETARQWEHTVPLLRRAGWLTTPITPAPGLWLLWAQRESVLTHWHYTQFKRIKTSVKRRC